MTGPVGKILLLRDVPVYRSRTRGIGVDVTDRADAEAEACFMSNQASHSHSPPHMNDVTKRSSNNSCEMNRQLTKMSKELFHLKVCVAKLEEESLGQVSSANYKKKCWKALALLLDRLFFLIYFGFIVYSLVQFFPHPK